MFHKMKQTPSKALPASRTAAAKQLLRRQVLARRRQLSPAVIEEQSQRIFDQLVLLPEFKAAKCLFCYVAMSDEVQTNSIIEHALAAGKTVCVPQVVDRTGGIMAAVRLHSLRELMQGDFSISTAPAGAEMIAPAAVDLIIVPGAGFSSDGGRLGMGGGFYDRYLVLANQAFSLGLAFDCQLLEHLPAETHDCKLTALLLADGLVRC